MALLPLSLTILPHPPVFPSSTSRRDFLKHCPNLRSSGQCCMPLPNAKTPSIQKNGKSFVYFSSGSTKQFRYSLNYSGPKWISHFINVVRNTVSFVVCGTTNNINEYICHAHSFDTQEWNQCNVD
jgi:hypothetical protein